MLTNMVTKLALVGSLLASLTMATPVVTPRGDSDSISSDTTTPSEADLYAIQPVPNGVVKAFLDDLVVEEGSIDRETAEKLRANHVNGTSAANADPDAEHKNPLLAKRADICYWRGGRMDANNVRAWANIVQSSPTTFYLPGLSFRTFTSNRIKVCVFNTYVSSLISTVVTS